MYIPGTPFTLSLYVHSKHVPLIDLLVQNDWTFFCSTLGLLFTLYIRLISICNVITLSLPLHSTTQVMVVQGHLLIHHTLTKRYSALKTTLMLTGVEFLCIGLMNAS